VYIVSNSDVPIGTGLPSSGKSLFIKMLEMILQNRCVHTHLKDPFERYGIKGASLVIVSEVEDYLDHRTCGILKAVIGRYGLPYQIKYEQSEGVDSFTFDGVFCFVSNKHMSQIFPPNEALYSRFHHVVFPNSIKSPPNTGLDKDLHLAIAK
jgi:phage/plasmid-associated DNA primase